MEILHSNGGARDKINPVHTINNSDHPYKGFDVNYDMALNIGITNWLSFLQYQQNFSRIIIREAVIYSPEWQASYHGTGYLEES